MTNRRRYTRGWRRANQRLLRAVFVDPGLAEEACWPERCEPGSPGTRAFHAPMHWIAGAVRRARIVGRKTLEKQARLMVGEKRWYGCGDRERFDRGLELALERGLVFQLGGDVLSKWRLGDVWAMC